MTQRIPSPAATPSSAMDRLCSLAYMAVSLLAIAAACAIAAGESAHAQLRLATVLNGAERAAEGRRSVLPPRGDGALSAPLARDAAPPVCGIQSRPFTHPRKST